MKRRSIVLFARRRGENTQSLGPLSLEVGHMPCNHKVRVVRPANHAHHAPSLGLIAEWLEPRKGF